MDLFTPFFETFFLVFLAEFGDKSQLVAMTLAARYRPAPVIIGAVVAFSVLNLLAVIFGAAVAQWVPGWIVAIVVAVLFFVFGFQSLRFDEEADDGGDVKVGKQLLISVFLLIFMAEFGDKTQLAVAALGSINHLWIVWGAATLALLLTTLLGVLVGRKLLYKLPLCWIHRGSGVLFVVFGCVALYESVTQFILV
ncbi:TMEM165/GDT1 family protein [Neptunomonas antarctica]|nr:TMEM165/GDT1 family protein [Neptunomonas antarctica]